MGNHAYLKKGQQDTSRSQQKVPSILLSFFFCLFSHFPILFQFLLFFLFSAEMSDQPGARCSAAYRRAADPEMDDPGGESEMHRNALSQSIPVYPNLSMSAMSAMSAMSRESVL